MFSLNDDAEAKRISNNYNERPASLLSNSVYM